jgi:recombinational DNA repair protein (RecF pathway)
MTYLFLRLLNAAKKECESVEQGLRKVLAAIIRIEGIGVCFEECVDNGKRG